MKKVLLIVMNRLLLVAVIAWVFVSCEKDSPSVDEPEEPETEVEQEEEQQTGKYTSINEWILENMQVYYLWSEHIPAKTDLTLYPSDYFETLIYDRKNVDYFSWIQENFVELMNSLSGVNTEAGYDFNLLRWSSESTAVIGYITYIKPGTSAENAGLRRGDFFAAINGVPLTIDNYASLLDQTSEPHTVGRADITGTSPAVTEEIALSVTEYAENPVLLDTVYDIQGTRAGYFVYNFFADDDGDGSLAYFDELNAVFEKFISAGIDELIVDLRYNSGGLVSMAQNLASMISGKGTSDLFGTEEYNAYLNAALREYYGQDYNKLFFVDYVDVYNASGRPTARKSVNKLSGLSRVWFIVSDRTASASELLISSLRPYMETRLTGGSTYGKNVGSITIYEDDPVKQLSNTWGMQPIVVRYANAEGFSDYGNGGMAPDMELYEWTQEILPLGDTNETLLNAVLNSIQGISATRLSRFSTGRPTVGSVVDRTPARRGMYVPSSVSEKIQTALSGGNPEK
jgi:C-terminal processing protease CtpA/Prc